MSVIVKCCVYEMECSLCLHEGTWIITTRHVYTIDVFIANSYHVNLPHCPHALQLLLWQRGGI